MKKVVIIGAGPAGLTAAHELLKRGAGQYRVVLLEQSEAFGGISRTVRDGGRRMDIGGHRFFSKNKQVMEWWFSQMPVQGAPPIDDKLLGRQSATQAGGPNPEKEDGVMLVRHRVSRIFYRGKFFDYPISLSPRTIRNMGFLTTLRAGFSYLASAVRKLPETSLENFYINRFGRVLYRMFFEGYTEKLWGRHPRDISADWGAQRVKGLSVMAIVKDVFGKIFRRKNRRVETSLIEQFYYPKLGPGQLWEQVAETVKAMGGEIYTGCTAQSFEVDEGGNVVAAQVMGPGGTQRVEGDVFISSMPVKDLVQALPQVPKDKAAIAQGLPYRDFVTVGMLVEKLNLTNETGIKTLGNIVPDCWIYVQDTGVKLGRIQIFNNWSPYLLEDPVHTVWIGLEYFCNEGDAFWNMGEEESVAFAKEELVKMGVLDAKAPLLAHHRERVQKAYPAYFDTYNQMEELAAWIDTHKNLYCVGRNGQHRYNNMDHSMVTSFEAVNNILDGRQDKENVWNVNTEQDYHEQKER